MLTLTIYLSSLFFISTPEAANLCQSFRRLQRCSVTFYCFTLVALTTEQDWPASRLHSKAKASNLTFEDAYLAETLLIFHCLPQNLSLIA